MHAVHTLRSDVALQVARCVQRMQVTQVVAAKRLGLPQPTLSKILNGHVSDISLELLIRTASRAGLSMTLQTGRVPQEAGAFVSRTYSTSLRSFTSNVEKEARQSLSHSTSRLTPTERLHAFLEHNQLLGALRQASQTAQAQKQRTPVPTP